MVFGALGDVTRDLSRADPLPPSREYDRMFLLSTYNAFAAEGILCLTLILGMGFILRLRHKAAGRRSQQAAETPGDSGRLRPDPQNIRRMIEKGTLPLDLGRADLSAWDLEATCLREAEMSHANLEGTFLARAQLTGAKLPGASLENADLSGASLQKADLRFANLRRASLRDADLSGACLRETQLDDADLRGADLTGASLAGAFLKGAHLGGVALGDGQLAEINTLFDARLDSELALRVSANYPHLLIDPVELFWKHHKIRLATMLNARKKRAARPVELKHVSVPVQGI
jgi:uncharacterized protein YjbI with pentapeptide repeats